MLMPLLCCPGVDGLHQAVLFLTVGGLFSGKLVEISIIFGLRNCLVALLNCVLHDNIFWFADTKPRVDFSFCACCDV